MHETGGYGRRVEMGDGGRWETGGDRKRGRVVQSQATPTDKGDADAGNVPLKQMMKYYMNGEM